MVAFRITQIGFVDLIPLDSTSIFGVRDRTLRGFRLLAASELLFSKFVLGVPTKIIGIPENLEFKSSPPWVECVRSQAQSPFL
jgi:hypothetical protein